MQNLQTGGCALLQKFHTTHFVCKNKKKKSKTKVRPF